MTSIVQVLDVVDTVMQKVKAVAEMPGVNLIPYTSLAASVIGALHAAYTAGKDVSPFLENIKKSFSKDGVPTQEDIDKLNQQIADLEIEVNAPLPPKEEGEPD